MKKWGWVILLSLFAMLTSTPCYADINVKDFTEKYEKAVIFITTYDDKGRKLATGSGFFINEEGAFVTSKHVLQGAITATVESASGEKRSFRRLVATRPDIDLVIAEIEKPQTPTPYLQIAKAIPAKGEPVVVFGNPLGVKFSVSEGIVSGIQSFPNQEWPQLTEMKGTYVQFTAAISSGSSGGPVLNSSGEVAGVTTWGFVPQISQNLNFAIPGSVIQELKNEYDVIAKRANEFTDITEKKKVAVLIMFGPKLLEQIKDKEKLSTIEKQVSEAVLSKFKSTKYEYIDAKKTFEYLEAYWKMHNGFTKKPPVMDDVDKELLVGYGENRSYDVLVFAGVEIVQAKQIGNLAIAAAAVEVEVDLRVTNISRKDYSYSQILTGQGNDMFQKFWGWEQVDMLKPVSEALTAALRPFRRAFSSDQIL